MNGFEDMQLHGIIKEPDSPWSSLDVLVQNGVLCFCVNYRKLDNVKRKDCFPLPCTDDTLDTLAAAKWFSTLDLKSSYRQVDLHPDKKKTAFLMDQGLWLFTVMTFGLCNTPVMFEQ